MDNGIYIALSRQMALIRDMDTVAGNIANVNTTGFQASHMMFDSYLADSNKRDKMAYANDISTYRNLENGSFTPTGNQLDMALNGGGYFIVQAPGGIRYTRAGNFQINNEGALVTAEGYPVLDQNEQPIFLPDDTREVTVGSAGNLKVNGQELAIVGVAEFANPQAMKKEGDRLLIAVQEPQENQGTAVLQGVLESANVKPVMEITRMIEVSRAVGGTAKYIEIMYDLQRKTSTAWTQQG